MRMLFNIKILAIAAVIVISGSGSGFATAVELTDIESDPANYRWLDVADQAYSEAYQSSYNYTQASVSIWHSTDSETLRGTLTADNLKPNFAYQLKIVGNPAVASNENIGYTGRWWQETWDGTAWSGANSNDNEYDTWKSNPDNNHRFTAYLVFDYFITDGKGDAVVDFVADSSYHVLWKTIRTPPSADDGPLVTATFRPNPSSPAYDTNYGKSTISVYGQVERTPVGGMFLPLGSYDATFVLTEESFHGSGGDLAGGWAAAMSGPAVFTLTTGGGPATDTVQITRAEYKADKSELYVEATSSEGGTAELTVAGYGPMTYNAGKNVYKLKLRPADDPGGSVTVTSNMGGSDTKTVTYK